MSGIFEDIIDFVGKQFGMIHKSAPCVYNGENGFLVWDYVLYNEITFVNERSKAYQSLFTSWDDSKTEAEFNRLLKLSDRYEKKQEARTRSEQNTEDQMVQIKKLKDLLDMGAISQSEFDEKKQKLLSLI